jgi:AAA+ superfamily predicted ATPase
MPEIKLTTPIGDVSIPYNEEAVLDLIRKANKTNSQDNSLSDEEILSFLDAEDYSELEEEWLFWEDSKVPVMIYDFNNWMAEAFDILETKSYSNRGEKISNITYQNFEYPHGKEKFATRATYFLNHKGTDAKYVWKIQPLDGVHIEATLFTNSQDSAASLDEVRKSFDNYIKSKGVLKNNVFNAKYQFLKKPKTTFDDVVLSKDQRDLIDKNIVKYINNLSFYQERGLPTNRGALIVGPPGTGKTLTCEALINTIEATIIYITADDIHEQGTIDTLYTLANGLSPSIVIVEDIDTLGGLDRREIGNHPLLGEFLNCLNGVEKNEGVITIATTNYPEHLDKALTRAGRFDVKLDFGLPDDKLRQHILEKYLSSVKTKKIDLKEIVKKTEGFSGAFLKEIVTLATIEAFEESGYNSDTKISQKHMDKSLDMLIKNRDDYINFKSDTNSPFHG